ncbi:hypothetical protein H4R18_005518 [Coemansia javaensis]|uniref:Uncharacterized protein n=1 Tax=Coemansia javaensis TaxID=2761396 RepID=A0A9W8LE61_9FUNG|nr:hypothetical protein H4R18_005518 [Coemansia javaensis]
MPTTPLPAPLRKRSEQYAKNITKRGHVKKSLNPVVEQRLEAERLRKKGLRTNQPAVLGPAARRAVVALLVITLGSALYQIVQPLIAVRRSPAPPKGAADLTRDQQARAAQAVLQELNRKAAEKYLRTAKDYRPPQVVLKADNGDGDDDGDDDDNDNDNDSEAVPVMAPLA